MLRSSFVPPKAIRELRDLTRYRRKLVESQAAERNRLQKLLETANIKLASVASDVFGVSGRRMLRALIAGKATTQEMAELARGRLRLKIHELEPALEGKLEEHHRFLLRLQLERLEAAEKDLAVLEQRIQEKLDPYAEQLALLEQIPGVDWTLAAVICEVVCQLSSIVAELICRATVWAAAAFCSRLRSANERTDEFILHLRRQGFGIDSGSPKHFFAALRALCCRKPRFSSCPTV